MKRRDSIRVFSRLRCLYSLLNDSYRSRAYNDAVKLLLEGKEKELSSNLKAKIVRIESSGKLDELVKLEKYAKLLGVKGFGKAFIEKLIKLKIEVDSPDDLLKDSIRKKLRESGITLTHLQLVGLKYHKKLSEKVSREKVLSLTVELKNYLTCKGIAMKKFKVVGSFRRKKEMLGDIDILIISSGREDYNTAMVIAKIHVAMESYCRYLTHLVIGNTKFSFLLEFENHVIQIDMRVVPKQSYHTAMLYFTGSGQFNIKMRSLAKSKGFMLNEYEMKKIEGKKVTVKSEKDIFNILNIKYIRPNERKPSIIFKAQRV